MTVIEIDFETRIERGDCGLLAERWERKRIGCQCTLERRGFGREGEGGRSAGRGEKVSTRGDERG